MRRGVLALWIFPIAAWAADLESSTKILNGEVIQHTEFNGQPRWKLIPYLWTDKNVNITCTFTKDFKVYTAPSLAALEAKVERSESVWCGWHNFLGQHSCVARLSPFGPVHVAVAQTVPTGQACQVELEEHVSLFMIAQTLAGALLFLQASRLSSSMFFRLGTGSAGVMMLSVLIVLFLLSRTLPSKKSAAALFAIFGSSFTGMVRYVFGQWIPSFEQLVYNKVLLLYLAASGLVGLAVTYYYDRDDNVKLHNILKYGLKLVGLLLMAFSTAMPEASITLCILLLGIQLVQPALFLWHKGEVSAKALSDLVSDSPAVFRQNKTRSRTSSRFKPQEASGESGTELFETEQEDEETETEEGEPGDSPSSQSSERAFAQASKVPLPEDEKRPRAAASEYKRTPTRVAMPLGMDEGDSPWLKQGLALNTETGRTVKMGGSTWNKLVLQGYQLDRGQGTLTPPPGRRKTAGQGSPASRVKARRSP